VYAIIKVYLTENGVDKKLKGGVRKRAMAEIHIQALQNYIDNDWSIILQSLGRQLKNDYNVDVSNMAIKTFNYTLKSTKLIPQRRNDEQSIDAHEAYANSFFNLISNFYESRLYFVDEVGFNVSMRCKRERSLRGTNALQTVAGIR